MNAIRKRNFVFAAFTGFGLLIAAILILIGGPISEIKTQMFLASVMIASGVSAGFWIRERGKLKVARLIAENPILHIRTATISNISQETAQPEDIENTEMFVSYFGILLDTKIIKFNQDGIRLRAVEIGPDFIVFTYGTEKRMQSTRLLRPPLDPAAMDEISERFRYETGITPTWIS